MTTVAINLPIYFTKYIAEKNEAEAKRKMYLNKKEDKQRELFAQLQTFLYNYTDTKSKLSLYENNLIPKAKQSLHLTRESYEVGSSDYTTFINALRTLLNFELAYQEYVMKYSTAIAKIEEITGYFSEGNNQKELKL